jgi:hypothetical protein
MTPKDVRISHSDELGFIESCRPEYHRKHQLKCSVGLGIRGAIKHSIIIVQKRRNCGHFKAYKGELERLN